MMRICLCIPAWHICGETRWLSAKQNFIHFHRPRLPSSGFFALDPQKEFRPIAAKHLNPAGPSLFYLLCIFSFRSRQHII